MLTNNKELNKILTSAETNGWRFSKGPKHIKGIYKMPDKPVRTATISASPSDVRALHNIRSNLKLKH